MDILVYVGPQTLLTAISNAQEPEQDICIIKQENYVKKYTMQLKFKDKHQPNFFLKKKEH